ncbi:high-affinity nitrate transporter-activating protein 2.1 [Cocos nucifera]|uniref:High-affinity nitrate transporter-activating protein 2.1 n=1 Tax=Cocos nucifera TaxID=13894 RepID=A0A8K0N934_COCNU|nr:high-affinity nitrate transporter-activating protein 2.1 [Cocos nucifera]
MLNFPGSAALPAPQEIKHEAPKVKRKGILPPIPHLAAKKTKGMGGLVSFSATCLFLLLSSFAGSAVGSVLFSTLPKTLIVSASPKQGQVLRAGEDKMAVSWALNQSFPVGTDEAYKKVKVRLCYAPVSQADRGWRKTDDDLSKDKTCQFDVAVQAYTTTTWTSFEYELSRELPTATYFVRAYALDYDGRVVAYGQTTDDQKATNLLEVMGISGRSLSLDIAAGCFSVLSVGSLVFFFVAAKRKKTNK